MPARRRPMARTDGPHQAGGGATRLVTRRLMLVAVGTSALACQGPEAARQRGGGPGGDIRNRDPVVEMHAGSRMYFETPCLLPEEECTGPRPASGFPGDSPGTR